MGRKVQVAAGVRGITLPNGTVHKTGDVVILTDVQWAAIATSPLVGTQIIDQGASTATPDVPDAGGGGGGGGTATIDPAVLAAKADLVGGVVPTSQIPSLALVTPVPVVSQAAMLALTALQVQPGDVAVRSDGAGTFMLTGTNPGLLTNWVLLTAPTNVVTSVNSQIGTVVLGKSDVGLANVDNTSDVNKPVSTAQAAALALAGKVSSVNTQIGAVVLGKIDVGLANVDNTSDVNKPVSTATAAAVAAAAGKVSSVNTQIGAVVLGKVDVGLANVDNTSDVNKPVSTATAAAVAASVKVASVNTQVGAVVLGKIDVGLANVDNTSDVNKPVSTAQAAAVAAAIKVSSVNTQVGAVVLGKIDVGLANVDNTSDVNKPVSTATAAAVAAVTNVRLTPTAVKTAAYTAAANDLVLVDSSVAAITITLPTLPAVGVRVGVLKYVASTNVITISPAGTGSIVGATALTTIVATAVLGAGAAFVHLGSNVWAVDANFTSGGSTGATGATGAAGTPGTPGAAGAQGAVGATGAVGPTGSALLPVFKTAAYTAAANDLVVGDATAGAFVVTLPVATAGLRIGVRKVDSSANVVTVATTAPALIDGLASRPLSVPYQTQVYVADGTNWQRLDVPGVMAIAATGTPSATTYLRGDGTWSTPVGGTGSGGAGSTFPFGNGADGAAIISSNTMLGRDTNYTDLTVNAGVSLNTGNFRVHVSGTLTNNGTIHNNGNNASANAGATYSGNGSNIATLPRSGHGGDGSAIGLSGETVNGYPSTLGGSGGGAYANDQVTVRVGGGTGQASSFTNNNLAGVANNPILRIVGMVSAQSGGGGNYGIANPGSGGSGGGGTDSGGGGGSGGGFLLINARTVINNGTISANGGNGVSRGYQATTASVNNGGGGGGGGIAWVNCTSYTGAQPTATGGTGGVGMGTGAQAGIAGGVGSASTWVIA